MVPGGKVKSRPDFAFLAEPFTYHCMGRILNHETKPEGRNRTRGGIWGLVFGLQLQLRSRVNTM